MTTQTPNDSTARNGAAVAGNQSGVGAVRPARIRSLDNKLINQIAAGEVIERPASILKELVENSLDAGATNIVIDIESGGIRRIRVTDDGCGITKEDLELALTRHATSKISSLTELEHVASLGFRGEALPSIAAVSRLTIRSRIRGEDHGWEIKSEGGVTGDVAPVPHDVGTTIEMSDLFYNVPARRKFLRTPATEFQHIDSLMRKIALSRPDVAIMVTHNGRQNATLRPSSASDDSAAIGRARVRAILGDNFASHAINVDEEASGLSVSGWVGLPTVSRAQRDMQYLFINGRPVKDNSISHAVRRGYNDVLYSGRHPAWVLYLEMDPRAVDVNVHPAKTEVRLRDGRTVYNVVYRSVSRALEGARAGTGESIDVAPRVQADSGPVTQLPMPSAATRPAFEKVTEQLQGYSRLGGAAPAVFEGVASDSGNDIERADPHADQTTGLPDEDNPLGFAIAQLHGVYVLAQTSDGLIIVDMHAAHERITYERMKREFDQRGVTNQPLLVPVQLNVSSAEADIVEQSTETFTRLGFEIDRSGPESITVRAIPDNQRTAFHCRLSWLGACQSQTDRS